MTKEEIEKNAKDYASEHKIYVGDDYCSYDSLVNAHIDGAKSRQSDIDIACAIIKDFLLENENNCRINNCNLCRFNSDYIKRAEKFLKEQNK